MAKSKALRLAYQINEFFVAEGATVDEAIDALETLLGGALDQCDDAPDRLERAVETLRDWVVRDRGVGGISL